MGLRNARHADESDAERKAKESAEINVKLDQIGNDVRDIKYDIAAVKRDVQGLTERVVIVEPVSYTHLDVYKRQSMGRAFIGNVKGPKGDKGDKGANGSQGPIGATGPAGPQEMCIRDSISCGDT